MSQIQSVSSVAEEESLDEINTRCAAMNAEQRVGWALDHLPGTHVLSSSFGTQAAVSLHLLTRRMPGLPVVLIDTGYLFPETYRFVDQLTERLALNLKVYRPAVSAAWQEARHGRLWQQGEAGLDRYNDLHKVEPMARALDELAVGTWYSGLRRKQSQSRAQTPFVAYENNRYKVCPIADWSDRDVWVYLKRHRLPYHPLWEQCYVSVGDVHSTRKWEPGMREEDTRFFGMKRECGLHSRL
jgi:phosphoadenosine phosphosulfate reductase